jgi:hypothetical protein
LPTPTYTPLATVTLGSAASSVTFSSIPATYRDLILVSIYKHDTTATSGAIRFNADSGSNYSYVSMRSRSPQSAAASSQTNIFSTFSSTINNVEQISVVNIMDYSATDKHKTCLIRDASTNASSELDSVASAQRWSNTSAITSMLVFMRAGNFSAGSNFSLYGIVS